MSYKSASDSAHARSFAPVAGQCPKILVLGSVPGQASMKAVQYYAHPRNAFWPITVATIQNSPINLPQAHAIDYETRLTMACEHGLALWDVLSFCKRPGSLDNQIERTSEVANPIVEWLTLHPSVMRVCFNGKTAAALFRRHIKKEFEATVPPQQIEFVTLPSTSPAMASLTPEQKLNQWCAALAVDNTFS